MATVSPETRRTAREETLAARYRRIRQETLNLVAPLTAEDQVVQAGPETSPTKWHVAHTTWFFERFCVLPHAPGYEPFDARYDHLFNSYYYTVGEMHARPERGRLSRPTVAEILDYRAHVDAAIERLLDEARDDDLAFLVTLGLNHEQQHQELMLTDIKQAFFVNPLAPAYWPHVPPTSYAVRPIAWVKRAGGESEIGVDAAASFAFDNETPRHRVLVSGHALADRLVTNGEFKEFIADGGYDAPAVWLADGWAKIHAAGWRRPLCWAEDCDLEFTLGGWRPIDLNAPVCHVSYYEADAFARWAGSRLPSEAEWELAAAATPIAGNFLDGGVLHPMSLAPRPAPNTERAPSFYQLWGDVWEWCATSYAPYPKFKPLAGSLGEYNGKFMLNQMVVRGGSCATWLEHMRPTYRSFFYPHDRWQFLGFRLAKDA